MLIPTAIVMLVLFGVSVFVFSPVISMLVTAGGIDMVPTRSDRSTGARFLINWAVVGAIALILVGLLFLFITVLS